MLFLLCAIPFWTSGIIRTIAWIPFLGRNGAFNTILLKLHITSQPLTFLLFSDFAVIITYVHLFTLLMVGPIANSLAKIDPALLEAARDAGASRWRTMVDVVIPLSKTGIALGSILVFTQVMGDYFVVKQMSGGQSASIVSMLSTEIQAMQYPPASANAMVLVVFVAIMVALHDARRRCPQGTGEIAMMVGGTSRRGQRRRPWTFYALAALFGAYPAVPLWADAGDLRAVVPGTEWRRHLPDGRRLAHLVPRHFQAGPDGEHPGLLRPLDRACRHRQFAHRGLLGRRRRSASAAAFPAPACCSTSPSPAW